jgi:ATP-dependent Clp protease ATP-binding subunit ClpB
LTEEVIEEIIVKELEIFANRINREKKIKIDYSDKVVKKISQESYSVEYGARPIKHYIEKKNRIFGGSRSYFPISSFRYKLSS